VFLSKNHKKTKVLKQKNGDARHHAKIQKRQNQKQKGAKFTFSRDDGQPLALPLFPNTLNAICN
jgi:hypothetical protein